MNTQITLGIPQSMLYHEYLFLWNAFLDELEIHTISSGDSNREIIKKSMELAVDEACFSTKIFLGHVNEMISLARQLSIDKRKAEKAYDNAKKKRL